MDSKSSKLVRKKVTKCDLDAALVGLELGIQGFPTHSTAASRVAAARKNLKRGILQQAKDDPQGDRFLQNSQEVTRHLTVRSR